MSELIRKREVSPEDVMRAHRERIEKINPKLNAVVQLIDDDGRRFEGPLHGVPFSVKDSIDVARTRCTAGTLGFRNAAPAQRDATLVRRLRQAGAVPIAKTNLPDLLFSFETDNLIFGRTSNPYDLSRTCGGSSGGEAALIAPCGSPLGLGSDCFGSVRLPAAFCGIAGIKPTYGRLPRTGHVPPPGGWIEKLWQIGPMARRVADVRLAMTILAGADGVDLSSPPAPLLSRTRPKRIALFTDNGIVPSRPAVRDAISEAARKLSARGVEVAEARPTGIEQCYELEFAIVGADGASGVDEFLRSIGSDRIHPLTASFMDRMRPYKTDGAGFATVWARWDAFRADMVQFFQDYDAILCPVYPDVAIPHGASARDEVFAGFSYTMAWSVAGFPAATVRCGDLKGLPIGVQVVTRPWEDMLALEICEWIEEECGGWRLPEL